MTGLRDLVALLYQADWMQLSLSGELATRTDQAALRSLLGPSGGAARSADAQPPPRWREETSSVLVAPGGRFRVENQAPDGQRNITVCDGESCWRLLGDLAARQDACLGDPALAQLLDPSWLLAAYELEETGTIETGDRTVYCVTATPRPLSQRGGRPDRIDVLVDTELGILLQLETRYDGRLIETVALEPVTMQPDQAPDPTRFSPPPGTTATDLGSAFEEFGQLKGPLGQVASTAADLTVTALDFAIKHAPRPAEALPGPPMPIPGPAAGSVADESPDNDVINRLYRTGLPVQDFTAELKQWTDTEVMLERWQRLRSAIPQPVTGIFGPDALWAALGERAPGLAYRTARLRIAAPGRYRIDHTSGDWRSVLAVACDGQRLQTRYRNRVVTGPVKQLDNDWARLADPAWLLLSDWRLSPAAETTVGGRAGLLVWADIRQATELSVLFEAGWYRPRPGLTFDRVAVVVDTELGILLRLVGYFDGRPAACFELHEVQQLSAADPAEFTLEIPPGTRVVQSSSPLAHLDMQGPVKAAKVAGQLGLAGVAAVSGWLQNRPRKHGPPGPDRG
jgi:outer membrane lipoprotein-sorting protein